MENVLLKKDGNKRKISWRSNCPFCGKFISRVNGVSMNVELDEVPPESYACDRDLSFGSIYSSNNRLFPTYWIPESVVDVYRQYLEEKYGVISNLMNPVGDISDVSSITPVGDSNALSLYAIPLNSGGSVMVTNVSDYNAFIDDTAVREAQRLLREEGVERVMRRRQGSIATKEENFLAAYNRNFAGFALNILPGNICQVLNGNRDALFDIDMNVESYDEALENFRQISIKNHSVCSVNGICKVLRKNKIFRRIPGWGR